MLVRRALVLGSFAGLAVVSLAACQAAVVTGPGWGSPDDPPTDDPMRPPPGSGADVVFEAEVLPLLDLRCTRCHDDATISPVFIVPPDVRGSVLEFPGLVTPGSPEASTLATYGAHRGPAWLGAEAVVVSDWITLEGGAEPGGGPPPVDPGGDPPPRPVGDGLETAPVAIVEGDNAVPLDEVGASGATLEFVATSVALGMHLSEITITAGAATVVVVHPMLVAWSGTTAVPDPYDRFVGLEVTVTAFATASLATSAVLVDYPATGGAFSIRFASVSEL